MTEKRRLTTGRIKKGLKSSLMLLLALTFILSTAAMAAPAAEASTGRFRLEWRVGSGSQTEITHEGLITPFGDNGQMRVGYQVGAAANQVQPITVTVTNNTGQNRNGLRIDRVSVNGHRDGDFQVSGLSRSNLGIGESATFTIQPTSGLASSRVSTTRIVVGVPGQLDQEVVFDVRFTLNPSLVIPANQVVNIHFGDRLVHNGALPHALTPPAGQAGTWRWVNPPATDIPVTPANTADAQLQTRTVEFVPTDSNLRSRIPVRQTVRVRVESRRVEDIVAPTMRDIALGQTLGDSAPVANSPHTGGGTWVWVDSRGNDFRNHRPLASGTYSFAMQFRPNVTANFVGVTPLTRQVTLRVLSPTLTFRANDITIEVGSTLPAPTYTITGLISGDQPGNRPTVRFNPDVTIDLTRPGTFPNAILIEGGTLPAGSAANNYTGVNHVNGTVRVVAAGQGGGAQQGGTWHQVGGQWYLRNAAGQNLTGWHQVGGAWYFLHTNATRGTLPLGAMATGWLNDGGTWYYMRSDGVMATGWVQVGGAWYFLSGSGAMMASNWAQSGGHWYFLGSNGVMVANDWAHWNGNYYFLRADGVMVTGNHTVNGVRHRFNTSGVWLGRG